MWKPTSSNKGMSAFSNHFGKAFRKLDPRFSWPTQILWSYQTVPLVAWQKTLCFKWNFPMGKQPDIKAVASIAILSLWRRGNLWTQVPWKERLWREFLQEYKKYKDIYIHIHICICSIGISIYIYIMFFNLWFYIYIQLWSLEELNYPSIHTDVLGVYLLGHPDF